METVRLIRLIADSAEPVRPLPRPIIRTILWAAISLAYVGLVVSVISPRDDLAAALADPRYLIEQLAALATGITAAAAAFATTIPGYSRRAFLLPVAPLLVWLGSLGQGCIQAWIRFGSAGLSLEPDLICFPSIVVVSAVPAVLMVAMLRRGAPLFPHATTALGALAAAGLGTFGLRLFHGQDASLMVLVWQFGSVFILAALASSLGRHVLNWRSVTAFGFRLKPSASV